MPIDYSKWDALELSDDSDIEVHPNVDKRSFIRAKQTQIHMERAQRRHEIETLRYERQVNDGLMARISALLTALRAHADEVTAPGATANPGEVAFRAVMESAAGLKPEDDTPPPRPEGVHANVEQPPTYTRMMVGLLDQVNKALEEKKKEKKDGGAAAGEAEDGPARYAAMVAEIEQHLRNVQGLQAELQQKLAELEREESRKITSESIHTGFDSSYVNKSKPSSSSASAAAGPKKKAEEASVELLNPSFSASASPSSSSPAAASSSTLSRKGKEAETADEDEEMEASPEGKRFAAIEEGDYRASAAFIAAHPQVLAEREQDGLMVMGFDAALRGDDGEGRRCVHQALLLQYCRALGGPDGAALFFRRVTTPGHQARDVFLKDVQETWGKIRTRAREIVAQRARDEAEGKGEEGVEQIQLHAVEPGTVINIRIPPAGSEDPAARKGREIFESFTPDMRAALETGRLDAVNKVLGRMRVDEAEDVVGKLGEAGILSLEEQIIDATTEEGRARLKQMEREAAATTSEEGDQPEGEVEAVEEYGDPE